MQNQKTPPESRYSRRPPRLASVITAPLYFVTFNTFNRAPVLGNETIHHALKAYGQEAAHRGIGVGRYVIMPDHIHLFIRMPANGPTLTRWVQGLRAVLGKVLLSMGHNKPHWQEGFFDHVLRSNESYSEKWQYVANNPLRAELVVTGEAWPYQGEIVMIDRA